jgi:hypothetical protein
VDLKTTFPLVTYRNADSLYGLDDFVRAELTSSTELSLSMYQAAGSGTAEWQVVSFGKANVQSGNVSLSSTQTTTKVPLTKAVDPAATWLLTSFQVAGTIDSAAELMTQGSVTDANNVTFERAGQGVSVQLTYYAIEFQNGTSVRSGTQSVTSLKASVALSPSVDATRSIALGGGVYQRGGATTYSAASNPGYATFNFDVGAGSALGVTRGATGASATVRWFVVEFQ